MRDAHAGVGLALLVGRCTVMGLRRGFAAVVMGVYVDAHGEEDRGLMRGRQLFLSAPRAERLARLWASPRLAAVVARARLAQDRIAHANFF